MAQESNNVDNFGVVVKASRKAKSMTQSQLAGRLGITTRYLKAIENSGRKPSYDLLIRIICELDIPTEVFFYTEDEKENDLKKTTHFRKIP